MADAIGLVVLAGLVALCAAVVPPSEVAAPLFFFVYLALAAGGIYAWHSDKSPQDPSGWLLLVLGGVILGALFLGAEAVVGHIHHPELSLFDAAKQSGGPFGFALIIMGVPAIAFIALAGAVRSFYVVSQK